MADGGRVSFGVVASPEGGRILKEGRVPSKEGRISTNGIKVASPGKDERKSPTRVTGGRSIALVPNADGSPLVVFEPVPFPEVIRGKVKAVVSSSNFDVLMVSLVITYTICIFTQLIVSDPALEDDIDADKVMPYLMALDTVLLVTFVCEISAKIYVYKMAYFVQNGECIKLYVIDAIAVTFCILLAIAESFKDVLQLNENVLRFSSLRALARLPRLVLMFKSKFGLTLSYDGFLSYLSNFIQRKSNSC